MNHVMLATTFFLLVNGDYVFGAFKAKNVVVVIADEFRHDETWGDRTHQYIPHIWNDLCAQGSQCVTFYGNPSYIVRVHLAILTGSWRDVRRLEPQDYPDQPTVFEYFRKGLGKDKKSCYYITSKNEFDFMDYSNDEEYGEDYGATVEFAKEMQNEDLYQRLVAYMKKNKPNLIVAILGGLKSYNKKKVPAEVERYRKQMVEVDKTVHKIWQAVQADPNYKDKTDFFFTNDHGDLIDHEDCDDECKRYWVVVAIGPDIKKNYATENKWRQVNICPTVGKILNFPTPHADKDAKAMEDFFVK